MIQEEIKRIGKSYGLNSKFKKNGELYKKSYKEFQDKVHWNNISSSQILSEEFIMKFKNKVNWKYIEDYQELTLKLKKEIEKRKLIEQVINS